MNPQEPDPANIILELWQPKARGRIVEFGLFISPVSQDDLPQLIRKRSGVFGTYTDAYKKYRRVNPGCVYEGLMEAAPKEFADLLETDIPIIQERQTIYDDIAGRFRKLMIQLRGTVLLESASAYYNSARQIQAMYPEVQNQKLDAELNNYYQKLTQLSGEHKKSSDNIETMKRLESLVTGFNKCFQLLSSTYNEKPGNNYDMFIGKLGALGFHSQESFFDVFDYYTRHDIGERHIDFDLTGRLTGQYRLDEYTRLEFKGLDYDGEYNTMRIFSPIGFIINLPEAYQEIVLSVFDEIRNDYNDRLVLPIDLVEWKERKEKPVRKKTVRVEIE